MAKPARGRRRTRFSFFLRLPLLPLAPRGSSSRSRPCSRSTEVVQGIRPDVVRSVLAERANLPATGGFLQPYICDGGNFSEVVNVWLAIDHVVNLPKGFASLTKVVATTSRTDSLKAEDIAADGDKDGGKCSIEVSHRPRRGSPRRRPRLLAEAGGIPLLLDDTGRHLGHL